MSRVIWLKTTHINILYIPVKFLATVTFTLGWTMWQVVKKESIPEYRRVKLLSSPHQILSFYQTLQVVSMYTVSQKVVHETHGDNFCQFEADFQNSFTAGKRVNFQENWYNTSHHTVSMLPHYLVKFRWSIFGISGRKCKQKCTMHWFLNTHTILMHLAYLLTCCFNFQFLLSILCKQQTVLSKQVLWTKQRFLHVWHGIDQTIIDYAIDERCGCLRACVRAKGEHFEQLCPPGVLGQEERPHHPIAPGPSLVARPGACQVQVMCVGLPVSARHGTTVIPRR